MPGSRVTGRGASPTDRLAVAPDLGSACPHRPDPAPPWKWLSHRAPISDSEQADDPVVKNELLELASVCEEVASNIEDHLTGGWLVTQGAGCRLGSTYWLEA